MGKIDKESLNEEINLIKSPSIKVLVEKCLERVPDGFWEAAASSTGKYHPLYSLGFGGLVRHTKAAVWIAKTRLELACAPFQDKADYIYAALILHDSAKNGLHWEHRYSCHEHPLLVYRYLPEEGLNVEWMEINDLICSHMGEWKESNRSEIVLPTIRTNEQFFVHECDFLASRKEMNLEGIFIDYPVKGSCVRLLKMSDEQAVPSGTLEKVTHVDSIGSIHVNWATGSTLALIPGEDNYEFVKEAQIR